MTVLLQRMHFQSNNKWNAQERSIKMGVDDYKVILGTTWKSSLQLIAEKDPPTPKIDKLVKLATTISSQIKNS